MKIYQCNRSVIINIIRIMITIIRGHIPNFNQSNSSAIAELSLEDPFVELSSLIFPPVLTSASYFIGEVESLDNLLLNL